MRTLAVATLKSDYNLAVLLEIARLPRSTFYYHLRALNRPDRHAAVKALITEIFSSRQGRYGHRRIRLCRRQLKSEQFRHLKSEHFD
ncbi:hypothetical protein EJO69_05675 [Flaviflexus salsibiostraticola]|uniref:Transposase n=1 Tax=Flaviflexus salsibiostraticola TaxID=1282737 RepID=A0A3Q8WTL9_9ACTO|nr:hypothetical protein [Flaviflexus salsibiostraticola]AZN29847.1 hypothetical protein EJO69_05675 [Flaviflexus salsibiostraticola]